MKKPKYNYGQMVGFFFKEELQKGSIFVVDAYGSFFQESNEPSYDILTEDGCLYKHVEESCVMH